jgi:hypothetical protein
MSDDLAKKIAKGALRIEWKDTESAARRVAEYAADRIKELEADLRKMALDLIAADGQSQEAYQAKLVAEAKLAKAEIIIRIIASDKWDERLGEAADLSCEYLAELKGEK